MSARTTSAFLDAENHQQAIEGEWSMDPEEIAVLLFTSGMTGTPKAAVLRHKHLVSYIWVLLNLPVPAMMKPLWFVFLRII